MDFLSVMFGRDRRGALLLASAVIVCGIVTVAWSTPVVADDKPLIVVVAQNEGTEVTDFLVPYGVLTRADIGDVRAVTTEEGPISFWPGLRVEADDTLASFDLSHPRGADLIVIPAVHDPEDVALIEWLKAQAAKGARLVSICDGALVLARTGLLDGRKATGHWFTEDERREDFSAVDWQANRRYVKDGNVATSAGVSASLPISLWLVEEMAGAARARSLADELAVSDYSHAHNSEVYKIGAAELFVAMRNLVFGWPRETYAIQLSPGMDEIALAFAVDMSARTYRSNSVSVAPGPVRTRGGLIVLPDEADFDGAIATLGFSGNADIVLQDGEASARQMLADLEDRYGKASAEFVALQLEYPR